MTEEEAKTKWCPQARESGGENRTFWNKPRRWIQELFGLSSDEAEMRCHLCIGSACMAWRWGGVLHEGRRIRTEEARFAAKNPGLSPGNGGMMAGDLPLGYCGLAGKP